MYQMYRYTQQSNSNPITKTTSPVHRISQFIACTSDLYTPLIHRGMSKSDNVHRPLRGHCHNLYMIVSSQPTYGFIQLWQMICGMIFIGRTFNFFGCDASGSKLIQPVLLLSQRWVGGGGGGCKPVCIHPSDYSVFHLPQL